MFNNIYKNRKVFVTGHTGFMGSWLCLWLERLNAQVTGYSIGIPTQPSHFQCLKLNCESIIGDVRNKGVLEQAVSKSDPEIVIHMAAQSLINRSYREPAETYDTNIMGTVNLLEACRKTPSVKVVIIITSDKCYENMEWDRGYREDDAMGGYDPYSASKGCAEIVSDSYRRSFFPKEQYGKKHSILLTTVRAGNVIGGGDWSEDRLIPDIARGVSAGKPVIIRSPESIRPWQHVLDALSGCLVLGCRLLEKDSSYAGAWNIGPEKKGNITVKQIVTTLRNYWEAVEYKVERQTDCPHEAGILKLDCSKANKRLGWKTVWDIDKILEMTGRWYRRYYAGNDIASIEQLEQYEADFSSLKDA